MIKVLARLELCTGSPVFRCDVTQEVSCPPLDVDGWRCIGGHSHKQKKKGKGTTLIEEMQAVHHWGWCCRMSLGNTRETELAAVPSQGTTARVPASLWVFNLLSKLSEESSQLLKSHMPKSSCSGKFFCLHILVQNWNLFLENTPGRKQPCLGKLADCFLLAELLFFGAAPAVERKYLLLFLSHSPGFEIPLEVQSPWESWQLSCLLTLKLFPYILPFGCLHLVLHFVRRSCLSCRRRPGVRRGRGRLLGNGKLGVGSGSTWVRQDPKCEGRCRNPLPPASSFLVCRMLRGRRAQLVFPEGRASFFSGRLIYLLC